MVVPPVHQKSLKNTGGDYIPPLGIHFKCFQRFIVKFTALSPVINGVTQALGGATFIFIPGTLSRCRILTIYRKKLTILSSPCNIYTSFNASLIHQPGFRPQHGYVLLYVYVYTRAAGAEQFFLGFSWIHHRGRSKRAAF
jgi:hypothetical protein